MADAGPRGHRRWLTEMTDADVTEERNVGLLGPDIHEAGPAGSCEVHFEAVAGELAEISHRLQTSAAEANAVLNITEVRAALSSLAEDTLVELCEAGHAH